MSWYRQVKILHTINYTMFAFIAWSILSIVLMQNQIDYRVYILGTAGIFINEYFMEKRKTNTGLFISTALVLGFMYFFINNFDLLIANVVYYIALEILMKRSYLDTLTYKVLRIYTKKCIIALIVLMVVTSRLDEAQRVIAFRFYILFLISSIIMLRECRAYSSQIKNKASMKNNIIISAGIIVFSFDFTSRFIFWLIGLIFKMIGFILSPLEPMVMSIVMMFSKFIDSTLGVFLKHHTKHMLDNYQQSAQTKQEAVKNIHSSVLPSWILFLIGFITICVILFVLYKLNSSRKRNVLKELSKGTYEEREKIKDKSKIKKGILDKVQDIFSKRNGINEEIMHTFSKFQSITYEADIYKEYMTATQLTNVTKAHSDKIKELNGLSFIYNEAKFSNRQLKKSKLDEMNNSYKLVKKSLGEKIKKNT